MSTSKPTNGNSPNFETGGREANKRLVEAYGFTTRQALADHLMVSKSTLANRYLRDTFPSDWIIRCALETGTSLTWLATGNSPACDDVNIDICAINCKKIVAGELFDSNIFLLDKALLPSTILSPLIISDSETLILYEQKFDKITDGNWILSVEGKYSLANKNTGW